MMMTNATKEMYLVAQRRLGEFAAGIDEDTSVVAGETQASEARSTILRRIWTRVRMETPRSETTRSPTDPGGRRMRELSLLRSQMKRDLRIYGRYYFDKIDADDKAFLRACGLKPWRWRRPWVIIGTRRREEETPLGTAVQGG
jgi:hypothetical protein